ncbi:hypothetical protein V6N12_013553 [Hibiscus sabdariffa]|uniref:Uncharacterized protein n=1 Tax=Hibiscus sabdariffa TaxID=183260 RepID=A0ABR2CBN2_9ROSI
MSKLQSVEGAVDDEKLVILHTCAIGWVMKAVSIRVLAQEMVEAGLEGFELQWVACSMVLLAFPDLEQRGRAPGQIDEMVEVRAQDKVFQVLVQEVELVHLSAVEEWEIDSGSEDGDSVQHGNSVVPPASHESRQTNQGRSPCWLENALWDMDRSDMGGVVSDGAIVGAKGQVEGLLGAIVTARATGPRGGVCSEGDILDAAVGDRSRESNVIEYHQGADIGHNSNLGFLDLGKADSDLVVRLGDKVSATKVVVGEAGAILVPVVGTVSGGVRKVKPVNSLVEALG